MWSKLLYFLIVIFFVYAKDDDKFTENNKNEKEIYTFNGLMKIESIPVLFPKDICLLKINEARYAACVHLNEKDLQYFVIFKATGDGNYTQIYEQPVPLAIAMDCSSFEGTGYVALAYNITKPIAHVHNGSPLFEIKNDQVRPIQYFTTANITSLRFEITNGDELLLFHAITTLGKDCPIYKWNGYHFNPLEFGGISCTHAKKIEPFWIGSNAFIAVANYADHRGNIETNSFIYKFDYNLGKYSLLQKIRTTAVADVKYFNILTENNERQHFVVFANSKKGPSNNQSLEAHSVIYKYENGNFVPFQRILLYAVEQFLPVQDDYGKFIMLISCTNQPTKFFQYNGWKFAESGVQFTDGALGKGVSEMRVYEDRNETFIVVANDDMLLKETNIYLPIYKKRKSFTSIKVELLEWSESAYRNLSKINLKDLKDKIMKLSKLKQKIMEANNQTTFEYAEIEKVTTKLLKYPKMKMSSNFWKTIALAKKALDDLEKRIEKLKFTKSGQIASNQDNDHLGKDHEKSQGNLNIESLSLGTLIVRDNLYANKINNQNKDHIKVKKIKASKIIIKNKGKIENVENMRDSMDGSFMPETNIFDLIRVKDITVTGSINGINFETLDRFALRKFGDQKILAPMTISSLKTNALTINGLINENVNVSKLVSIDEGNFVINQNIRFEYPVQANEIIINDRLNDIPVIEGKLDILLTSSDKEQIITGKKIFETVTVLEPITIISGKVTGPSLDQLSPITSIDEDVLLQGDYIITGNVDVRAQFSSHDIFGESQTKSILYLMNEGLKNDIPIQFTMNFQKPVEVDNAILSFINGRDLRYLIKTNIDDVQIITGHKTFMGDLKINGTFEAYEVNGIKMENLEKLTLQRTSPQIIMGKLRFKKITIPRANADQILIGQNNIEDLLTTSTQQTIYGNVMVNNFQTKTAHIDEIITSSKIMSIDIDHVLRDTMTSNTTYELFGQKYFDGIVKVNNLFIKKTINAESIERIEKWFSQINGNIEFPDVLYFSENVSFSNIQFNGKLNGISADEFGKCWLLSELTQTFTAPQTFTSVTIEDELILGGTINGYTFEDLVNNTYSINNSEYINSVIFENNVTIQGPLITNGQINGIDFANEVLLTQNDHPQEIISPTFCNENVYIKGDIKNLITLNQLDLDLLQQFLSENKSKIIVNRATFEIPPEIIKLNSYNLEFLRNNLWLANEDVTLNGPIIFNEVYFNDYVKWQGPINGVDLKFLAKNYFSLSKSQVISAPMVFNDVVIMKDNFRVTKMKLKGPIVDLEGKYKINFDHFVSNILNEDEDQVITGKWKIFNVIVQGDLNNVLINNLRLYDDTLRYDVPLNNITAPKYFTGSSVITINNLHCTPKSRLNGIDMFNWLTNTVFLQGNHTIQGITTIDTSIFFNDILVRGTVNNNTFDENSILLKNKDQRINGNLYLITKYPNIKQILPLTFENVQTNYVNEINLREFFENLATNSNDIIIDGELQFERPLIAKHLNAANGVIYDRNIVEIFGKFESNPIVNNVKIMLNKLMNITEQVEENYKRTHIYLSHFEKRQIISGYIRKIVPLTLSTDSGLTDFIAVLSGIESSHLTFYKWIEEKQIFTLDNDDISQHFKEQNIKNIFSASNENEELFVTETCDKDIYYHNFINCAKGLQTNVQLSSNLSQKIQSIRINDQPCIIRYSEFNPLISVSCFHQEKDSLIIMDKKPLYIDHAKQVLALEKDYIVTLLNDLVKIWSLDAVQTPYQYQTLHISNAMHITGAYFENSFYLAICTKGSSNSLHFGSIEIYRSMNNSLFQHYQSIEVSIPMQAVFSTIPESSDLLLYTLSNNPSHPLFIFQYHGIDGFNEILKSSAAPMGNSISMITLNYSKRHFVSVISNSEATFIESVLKIV